MHADWHLCERFWREGLPCPFQITGAPDPVRQDDDAKVSTSGAAATSAAAEAVAASKAPNLVSLARQAELSSELAHAEEVVARDAAAIPLQEGVSLADRLREGVAGPAGMAAAVAAGAAISDVLRRGRMRLPGAVGGGGGFNVEMVFDPRKALPVK